MRRRKLSVMGEAKRRREYLATLTEIAGGDLKLAQHMLDNQVAPQETAAELRRKGVGVDVTFVNTAADAKGFEVRCAGCGCTARMPTAPPAGRQVFCPDCQRSWLC